MKGNVVGQGGVKITGGTKKTKTVRTNCSVSSGDILFASTATMVEKTTNHSVVSSFANGIPFNGVYTDGVNGDMRTLKIDDNRTLLMLADTSTVGKVQIVKRENSVGSVGAVLSLGSAVARAISGTYWKDNKWVIVVANTTSALIGVHVISIVDMTITLLQTTDVNVTQYNPSQPQSIGVDYISNDKFAVVHSTTSQYGLVRTIAINASNVASTLGTTYTTTVTAVDVVLRKVKGDRFLTLMKENTSHVVRLFSMNTTTGDVSLLTFDTPQFTNSNTNTLVNLTDTVLIFAVATGGTCNYRAVIVNDNNTLTLGTNATVSTNSPNNVDVIRLSNDSFILMGYTSNAYGFLRFGKLFSNNTLAAFGNESNGAGNFAPYYGQTYGQPKLLAFSMGTFGIFYKAVATTRGEITGYSCSVPINAIALSSGTSGQTINVLEILTLT